MGIIGETIEEEEKYLIVLADEMEQHGILNYLNKTEADRKELYFWPYIYRYIGKKAYVEEIIKNNTSIIKILKDIYTQCFKEAFNTYVKDLKRRIHKTYPIKQNIQQFGAVTVKFLIAFLTPFMPRKVLLYFLKKVSDKNYKELERKYRNTEGEQKYNFFVEPNELREEYKFTHEQYLKSKRPIENSLRTIVKRNSEIMGEQLSKEKIDLNTIAKMQ